MTCQINFSSNFIAKPYLVIKLPSIIPHGDYTSVAWVKNIGYALINNIQFQVNNKIIEQVTGEWMYIYNQLTNKHHNIDKMIGNIKLLTDYSESKEEYELCVPIPFTFFEYKNSFETFKQQNRKINIVVTFNDVKQCINFAPQNFLTVKTKPLYI